MVFSDLVKIATWNVNSIRTRLPRLLGVLERHEPDVLCLQELKVEDEGFPALDVRQAGYYAATFGQRTYNGVAILSREKPEDVTRSLSDGVDDDEARLISAKIGGIRIICVYVPNGGTVGSDKWEYKLEWLGRLRRYLERTASPDEPLVLCGDMNIAPEDRDVKNEARWADTVLCHPDGRTALAHVAAWGLVDTLRLKTEESGIYTWWDYRKLGYAKNDGLRIDVIYVTRPLANGVKDVIVDRNERKGKQPSDHVPLIVELAM